MRALVLHYLLVDELLPLLDGVLPLVDAVIVWTRCWRVHLPLVVPDVDVRMQEGVVDGYPALRVDDEHAREKIARLARLQPVVLAAVGGEQQVGEQFVEREAGIARPVLDVVADRRLQPDHELSGRRAQLLDDLVPLVDVIGAGKEDAAAYHLTHDASYGPDVHVLRVSHAEDDLRRPVVSGHHVRCHHEGRPRRPCQSEVQNLQRAVRSDDDVARLQIPVYDAGRVQMLDAAQHLIEQVTHPLVIQVHLNHLTQIRVHQLHHQVDILELFQRYLRRERIQQTDYVFVVDEFHEFELAVGPLRVRHILEGATELLYGHILLGDGINGGTDDALGAGTDGFQTLVAFQDREFGVPDLDGIEQLRYPGHLRPRVPKIQHRRQERSILFNLLVGNRTVALVAAAAAVRSSFPLIFPQYCGTNTTTATTATTLMLMMVCVYYLC